MKKYLPIILLVLLSIGIYFSPLRNYLTFEQLKIHQQSLKEMVASHQFFASLLFISIYAASTALSLPVGIFLSVLGGFLFPQPWSTLFIVIGATLGASILFLAARTAVGDLLRKKAGPFLQKMEAGFQKNSVSYLLFLRFVPLFPFWAVNLVPAFFNISLWTFVWTTFIGITPGAFAFAQAGAGLGAIFEQGKEFSLEAVFNWKLKIALIALGVLALIPLLLKKWFKWHRD